MMPSPEMSRADRRRQRGFSLAMSLFGAGGARPGVAGASSWAPRTSSPRGTTRHQQAYFVAESALLDALQRVNNPACETSAPMSSRAGVPLRNGSRTYGNQMPGFPTRWTSWADPGESVQRRPVDGSLLSAPKG